jgi:hypothetical protein
MFGLTMGCYARIPGGFRLEHIFDTKTKADRAAWLIGAILEKQICFSDYGGAPMSSSEVRKICGNPVTTKQIVERLKECQILFVSDSYEVGAKFKNYLVNPKWLKVDKVSTDNVVHHHITSPSVITTIRKSLLKGKDYEHYRWDEFHFQIYENLQYPQIDPYEVDRCFRDLHDPSDNDFGSSAAVIGFQLDQILSDTSRRMSVSKTGRVYTPLCRLKSWVRGCFKYNEHWCVGHDVKACQPTLLAALMLSIANGDSSFFERTGVSRHMKSLGIKMKLLEACDITQKDAREFAGFIEENDIYDVIVDKLKSRGHYRSRDDIKIAFMRDIFAKKSEYASVEEHEFRELFPVIWRQIKAINRNDYRTLINFMQFMESEVVIHHTLQKAYQLGCRGFFTVHDSIYAADIYTDAILKGFEYASNAVGIKLRIDISQDIVERRRQEIEDRLSVEDFNRDVLKA